MEKAIHAVVRERPILCVFSVTEEERVGTFSHCNDSRSQKAKPISQDVPNPETNDLHRGVTYPFAFAMRQTVSAHAGASLEWQPCYWRHRGTSLSLTGLFDSMFLLARAFSVVPGDGDLSDPQEQARDSVRAQTGVDGLNALRCTASGVWHQRQESFSVQGNKRFTLPTPVLPWYRILQSVSKLNLEGPLPSWALGHWSYVDQNRLLETD